MSGTLKGLTDQEIAARARSKINSASAEITELARRGYDLDVSTMFHSSNGKIDDCIVLTDFVKVEKVTL